MAGCRISHRLGIHEVLNVCICIYVYIIHHISKDILYLTHVVERILVSQLLVLLAVWLVMWVSHCNLLRTYFCHL